MAVKLMIAARRRAGMSRRRVAEYYRSVHGVLVTGGPPDWQQSFLGYVQNRVRDGLYGAAIAGERDLVSELWFEDAAALKASTSMPYYHERVAPDEPNFATQTDIIALLTRESAVKTDGPLAGRAKMMMFHHRSEAASRDAFVQLWDEALGDLLAAEGETVRRCMVSRAMTAPSAGAGAANADPFLGGAGFNDYEGVTSLWLDGGDERAEQCATGLQDRLGEALDRERSFALIVDELPLRGDLG